MLEFQTESDSLRCMDEKKPRPPRTPWHKPGTYYAANREAILARAKQRALSIRQQAAGRAKPSVCDACSQPSDHLSWDHDHATGKFRGWICSPCNLILGHAKDDAEVLRALIKYLSLSQSV